MNIGGSAPNDGFIVYIVYHPPSILTFGPYRRRGWPSLFLLSIYHVREIYYNMHPGLVFQYTTFSRTFIYRLWFIDQSLASLILPPSIFTLYAIAGLFLRQLCDIPSLFTLYILTRNETHIYFLLGLCSHYALPFFYFLTFFMFRLFSLSSDKIETHSSLSYLLHHRISNVIRWSWRYFMFIVL